MSVRWPCPRCPTGTVAVGVTTWPTPAGRRCSIWLDEPARCAAGCPLTPREVARLLERAAKLHAAGALPIPLWTTEEVSHGSHAAAAGDGPGDPGRDGGRPAGEHGARRVVLTTGDS